MNTFYCTHCGKKNALFSEDVPVAEPMHEHSWFKAARLQDGTQIYDCNCGERKRVTSSIQGDVEVIDSDIYAVGSVNRALYVK